MSMSGAGNASRGFKELYLDFLQYETAVGNHGLRLTHATAAPTLVDPGVLRLPMDGNDADSAMAATRVIWRPDLGDLVIMEARVRTSDADKSSIFVGLSDADTESNGVVIEAEDGTLNTVPTDAVGFLLEGEQDTTWQSVAVKNNTDIATVALGPGTHDAQDNRWQMLRLEVTERGHCTFYIDGDRVDHRENMVDANETFGFVFSADARGTAYNADLDEVYMCGPRAR